MTKIEGERILFNKIKNDIKDSGWWIFNKRNIELSITRILEPYEKKANLPLPDKIFINEIIIDKHGIQNHKDLTEWSEVCASGISTESILDRYGENYIYIKNLLICLNNGKTLEYRLKDVSKFKGLLGHFIEEYKIEFQKITHTTKA